MEGFGWIAMVWKSVTAGRLSAAAPRPAGAAAPPTQLHTTNQAGKFQIVG